MSASQVCEDSDGDAFNPWFFKEFIYLRNESPLHHDGGEGLTRSHQMKGTETGSRHSRSTVPEPELGQSS